MRALTLAGPRTPNRTTEPFYAPGWKDLFTFRIAGNGDFCVGEPESGRTGFKCKTISFVFICYSESAWANEVP